MPRNIFPSLALAVACLAPVATVAADEIYVGSNFGTVMYAQPDDTFFRPAGICGGPIRSMTMSGAFLLLGDTNGRTYRLDTDATGGGVGYYFNLPDANHTAIVAHNDSLFVSNAAGIVREVALANGAVLNTYNAPSAVNAMVRDSQYLYVGGPDGAIYRAPLSTGEFSYFACACLGVINSLAVHSNQLVAGDQMGTVMVFDKTNGQPTTAYTLPGNNVAMIFTSDGGFHVADNQGAVRRVNVATGEILQTRQARTPIRAMAAVGEPACAADFNFDSEVNSADFFAFLDVFFTGSMAADFNGDTTLNSSDFFEFLNAFFTPCN